MITANNKIPILFITFGQNKFKRVKIGIHRPEDKQNVANYVLKDFSKDEQVAIKNKLAPNLSKYITLLLDNNDSKFMNKLHLF